MRPRRVTGLRVMRWQDNTAGGGRWLPEEYRRDLKKIYAQLEEARGWGGPEVTELREEKWERALAALLRRARKTDEDALEGSQKRQVENTHSPGTTINLNGDKCMDRRTPCYGSPDESLQSDSSNM
jgi:hypothetical protein